MELKNKFAIVGFMLALANLGSVTAQADPAGLDAQGEFFTISVENECLQLAFPGSGDRICIASELYDHGRRVLNDKAAETCSGRNFSIDESSVVQTMDSKRVRNGGILYTVSTTARMFCMSGE